MKKIYVVYITDWTCDYVEHRAYANKQDAEKRVKELYDTKLGTYEDAYVEEFDYYE